MQTLTAIELLELALEEQVENSYSVQTDVVGLSDVAAGYRPAYPVTVYQLSGDDKSGIAGLLFPSGQFLPVQPQRTTQRYWDHTETYRYETVENLHYSEVNPGETRVVGNSWDEAEVLWDGTSGLITLNVERETEVFEQIGQKANGSMTVLKGTLQKVKTHVREHDTNSLLGDNEVLARPPAQTARKMGVIHGWGTSDDYSTQRAA
jgi:hypothetical protein